MWKPSRRQRRRKRRRERQVSSMLDAEDGMRNVGILRFLDFEKFVDFGIRGIERESGH